MNVFKLNETLVILFPLPAKCVDYRYLLPYVAFFFPSFLVSVDSTHHKVAVCLHFTFCSLILFFFQ